MDQLLVQFLLGGAILFLERLPEPCRDAFGRYDQLCKVSRFLDACEHKGPQECPGSFHPEACGECDDCRSYAAFVLEPEPATVRTVRRPRFEDAVGWN